MNPYVWLQTVDGIPRKVDGVAMYCPMIYTQVTEHGKGFTEESAILLPACISPSILNLIVYYCQFYYVSEFSQQEKHVFDDKFIDKDTKTVFELGVAAISLGLTTLVDLTLDELIRQTKGQKPRQAAKLFPKDNNELIRDYSRVEFMKQFHDRKHQEQRERLMKMVAEKPDDDRPVDDLVQFINGKDDDEKGTAAEKKKKKKNRRKKENAKDLSLKSTIDENRNKECMICASEHTDNGFEDNENDLDPLKMEIIDRDVEEFKRRLNLSWKERISEMMNIKYK